MERFLAFLAVAAVLVVTPGPDTALTIRIGFGVRVATERA